MSPRILAIMGSGETSPTMAKTHRQLLSRLGEPPVPAVLLDTAFGFQENAGEISSKAVRYFAESVGAGLEVASFRSASAQHDPLERELALGRIRAARYVFAGPGSPSYALRQWEGTAIPQLLAEKLRSGGAICFASAAALTLGTVTVPVYEVYKVGEDPHWLKGLDLMSQTGLEVAVIPHFNNSEGGTHDTRFCYLGERRLAVLEKSLPEGNFVLGVDEHTACIFDLDEKSVSVVGHGAVTVRSGGVSAPITAGTTLEIEELGRRAADAVRGSGTPWRAPPPDRSDAEASGAHTASSQTVFAHTSPLLTAIHSHRDSFERALERHDASGAARSILELDDELAAWSADTLQSDELDQGRAALRSMIARLGELAQDGLRDPRDVLGGFVDALLETRSRARQARRWDEADLIRDGLTSLGVEVRDTTDGTEWVVGPKGGRIRAC